MRLTQWSLRSLALGAYHSFRCEGLHYYYSIGAHFLGANLVARSGSMFLGAMGRVVVVDGAIAGNRGLVGKYEPPLVS